MDEAWFYLISLAIEAAGAPALPAILEAMHAVVRSDLEALATQLRIIANCIEEITRLLLRMYEKVCGACGREGWHHLSCNPPHFRTTPTSSITVSDRSSQDGKTRKSCMTGCFMKAS